MTSARLGTVLTLCAVIMICGSCDDQSPQSSPPALSAIQENSTTPDRSDPPLCCPIDDQPLSTSKISPALENTIPATTQPTTQPTTQSEPEPRASYRGPHQARSSDWIEPDRREAFDLDFKMTDHDGNSLTLEDLVGKPIAMSFIFTRCPNPQMCPLITTTMARLQDDLDRAGMTDRVWLVLLSYDPVFDTPDRLKRYAADRGVRFTNAKILRPDPDLFRELLHEFQIGVRYNPDGSIGHFIELLLLDREGRFVRDYQGDIWDNTEVSNDLIKLASEH